MNDDEWSLPVPVSAWIYPTLIHGVVALTLVTRLMLAGPRWEHFYDDWKLALPATTEAFVVLGMWMEAHFFLGHDVPAGRCGD